MTLRYSKKFGSARSKKVSWRNYLEGGMFRFMANGTTKTENTEIAARLRLLRHVVAGESQTAFALRIGIEVKRWNNFERGSPLSKEVAILLVKAIPGLTLDWLYLGIESGLPIALQRVLVAGGNANKSADGLVSSKP